MLKKNRTALILSSIIIFLPVLIGLVLWNKLPDTFPTHWNSSGSADGFSSKSFAIFGLPLIMLALHWLGILITMKDPKNKEQSAKVFGMVLWILPMVSLITNGMVYTLALGYDIGVDVFVRILLGLIFVILGNYMPKCKQNYTIGIKVSWALKNEENWNKTHRFAGKVWFLCGLLMLATLLIPLENMMFGFLTVIVLLSGLPVLYSYLYYRKQLASGSVRKEDYASTPAEKKSSAVVISTLIITFAIVALFLFTGSFEVELGETSFSIEADYWDDITVDYASIDTIEWREHDDPGSRTYGYGSVTLLMGDFQNTEFNTYTRYSYTSCDSCIVITSGGKVLVINQKDEESTKELFETLQERMGE